MEHIAISVIVPIYNTKPYLAECIESILAQKINVPIEVLLIDDGSTDGCGEVCDKYAARDERVRVIHQENQGLSAIIPLLTPMMSFCRAFCRRCTTPARSTMPICPSALSRTCRRTA